MAGFRSPSSQRLSMDAEKLVADASALAASGCRIEDRFWENRLATRLTRMLKHSSQAGLDSALGHLYHSNLEAYDILAELAETMSESVAIRHAEQDWDVLLLAAPILVQTRYRIPSGALKPEQVQLAAAQLRQHILADAVQLAVSPYLYSIDQLPATHAETHQLTQKLGVAALSNIPPKLDLRNLPETAPVLADPRYLLAAIAVPAGMPLFRWQMEGSQQLERDVCLSIWQEQMQLALGTMLPGCEFEPLLPDAFFVNCREADKRIRPLTVKAAVQYLEGVLDIQPGGVAAIIGGFGETQIEEYRISFTIRGEKDVLYGVVWPLYDRELQANEDADSAHETPTPLEQISTQLRSSGVVDLFRHANLFDPEYCDDCSGPLFANRSGELVHAEMPEDTPAQHPLFH